MKDNKDKTVFVGVSGGVDSSVAAALLKDQGYNVVGVFIRTWTPDFIDCTWRDERRDAMRVCAHLDIPFLECDAEEAYKKGVADYMIEEYKKGNTPNPDVMCNREVKFGVFWKFACEHGADYIATGHYSIRKENFYESKTERKHSFSRVFGREVGEQCQTSSKKNISFMFQKSPDSSKDQSYFLWTLTQYDLAHTFFPIGHLKKTEVRKLAVKYKLPTAIKKDSQGVCFLGPLDMKDFLKHYIDSKKGEVLNDKGKIIGTHDGAIFFTLGERHGFSISKNNNESLPYYVIEKNIDNNTLTVSNSTSSLISPRSDLCEISVINTNWINEVPKADKKYTAQIRYHGEFLDCKIHDIKGTNSKIIFKKNILVDKGQSVVVYDKDICLGGGIVE